MEFDTHCSHWKLAAVVYTTSFIPALYTTYTTWFCLSELQVGALKRWNFSMSFVRFFNVPPCNYTVQFVHCRRKFETKMITRASMCFPISRGFSPSPPRPLCPFPYPLPPPFPFYPLKPAIQGEHRNTFCEHQHNKLTPIWLHLTTQSQEPRWHHTGSESGGLPTPE